MTPNRRLCKVRWPVEEGAAALLIPQRPQCGVQNAEARSVGSLCL
jgi:hypothetical protein